MCGSGTRQVTRFPLVHEDSGVGLVVGTPCVWRFRWFPYSGYLLGSTADLFRFHRLFSMWCAVFRSSGWQLGHRCLARGRRALERYHVLKKDDSELVWHRLSSSGTAGEQYGVRSRLQLVLFMRNLIENSTVWIENDLASLLVAWGRDIWLRNAPGNAFSCGPGDSSSITKL